MHLDAEDDAATLVSETGDGAPDASKGKIGEGAESIATDGGDLPVPPATEGENDD